MAKIKLLISIGLVLGAVLLSIIAYYVGGLTSLTEFTTRVISGIVVAMIAAAIGISFGYKASQKPEKREKQEGSVAPGVLLEKTEDTRVDGVSVPEGMVGVHDRGGKRDEIKNVKVRKESEQRDSDET